MKNKKVLWAIVLFFIFGFVAFAFANPFNNDDEQKKDKKDTPVVDKTPVDVTPTPTDNLIRVVTLTNKVTEPTVILDTVAPLIDEVTLSEYGWTKNDVTVTVNATDNVALATEAYSIDGGVTFQASNQFVVSAYTGLTVIVKDAAGNLSEPYKVDVLVDKINPAVPTILGVNLPLSATAVNLTITPGQDLESGVYGIEVSEDEITWTSYTGVIAYNESGDYTLYARTVDNVGNVSDSTMVSFAIDVDAPVVNSLTYSNTNPTRDNVVATIVTNEPVTIDGWTEVNTNTYTKEYPNNVSETVTLTDNVGNTSEADIEINNIDRTAAIVAGQIVDLGNKQLKLVLTSNEALQSVVGYTTTDNLVWEQVVANTGAYNLSLTVQDLAGNETLVEATYSHSLNVTYKGNRMNTDRWGNLSNVELTFGHTDSVNPAAIISDKVINTGYINFGMGNSVTKTGTYSVIATNGLEYTVEYSAVISRTLDHHHGWQYSVGTPTVTATLKTT